MCIIFFERTCRKSQNEEFERAAVLFKSFSDKSRNIPAKLSAGIRRIYLSVRLITLWWSGSDSAASYFHVLKEFWGYLTSECAAGVSSCSPAPEEDLMRIPVLPWLGGFFYSSLRLQLVLRLHDWSLSSNPKTLTVKNNNNKTGAFQPFVQKQQSFSCWESMRTKTSRVLKIRR